MADVQRKQKVQAEIKAKVKPKADKAFAGILKAVPELAKSISKVQKAIKEGVDPGLMKTYRRDLVIHVRAVSDAKLWAVDALEALEEVTQDDDDFAADADEVEALQKKLAGARDLLADQIVKGKDLEEKAAAAADKGAKSEKAAHREWDGLIAQFESSSKLLDDMLKQMRSSIKDAETAAKDRDAGKLKTIKAGMQGFASNKDVDEGKFLFKKTNDFMTNYPITTFSDPFLDEIARDRHGIIGEYDKKAKALQDDGKKLMSRMAEIAVEPPDAVRATAKLGFKANFIAKVGTALKLAEGKIPAALEEIGKAAGKPGKGKDMLDMLKKEKIYP